MSRCSTDQPLVRGLLAGMTIILLVAGGGVLTMGFWQHDLAAFAVGVALVFGGMLSRPA